MTFANYATTGESALPTSECIIIPQRGEHRAALNLASSNVPSLEANSDSQHMRPRRKRGNTSLHRAMATAGIWLSTGCGEVAAGTQIADEGDVRVEWYPTADAELESAVSLLHDTGIAEEIASNLNGMLRLPRDIVIAHLDCGEENAFYLREHSSVLMCYEMLGYILGIVNAQGLSEEDVLSAWRFVLFHELGHALIDQYNLVITGKEEDAVDDFSSIALVESEQAHLAFQAAAFWQLTDQDAYDGLQFADTHSLSPQRFFNILCTIYGYDTDDLGQVFAPDLLPESRAEHCQYEYQQKSRAWNVLLAPYKK